MNLIHSDKETSNIHTLILFRFISKYSNIGNFGPYDIVYITQINQNL